MDLAALSCTTEGSWSKSQAQMRSLPPYTGRTCTSTGGECGKSFWAGTLSQQRPRSFGGSTRAHPPHRLPMSGNLGTGSSLQAITMRVRKKCPVFVHGSWVEPGAHELCSKLRSFLFCASHTCRPNHFLAVILETLLFHRCGLREPRVRVKQETTHDGVLHREL